MRITASHIIHWVETNAKVAQADLPRWVRRLCFQAGSTREIAFPAGDSSFTPGLDGTLSSERGNAWVPEGKSCWEVGCDKKIPPKAADDYQKRTRETSEEVRMASTFIFVTPRRWQKKKAWVKEQLAKKEWADVRVHDADDLEQWLEQYPSVALQFGEEVGLLGDGVESCTRHWQTWAQQCNPAITRDAMVMGRAASCDKLKAEIAKFAAISNAQHVLSIRADSVQEAVALAVAAVLANGNLADGTLVVTSSTGWRFVEVNPALKIAIAAAPEVAESPVMRAGLLVIVPNAIGNLPTDSQIKALVIERPHIYDYQKALVSIGIEESDAKRLALSTGRSWSVLRRHKAHNPAIRHPAWLTLPQSASLALLCLLGTWNALHEEDKNVVARLANRPYEEVENDLRQLAQLDDAPIICIGSIWKAKSPIELLAMFGECITTAQLDRFFMIAEEMLSSPDPQLELPHDKRWAAQVYGKVPAHSGFLFDSVCDALIKLAVRGPDFAGLKALRIAERVEHLVLQLFDDADATRWLSLASHLPALAEASPKQFLSAIEKSLRLPEKPVTRLLTESGNSGVMGRCWHAGLLWALEIIAWDGSRLARVALILAQLSHVPIQGNWGNKPSNSLFGLFRAWFPQTAASLKERINVLDLLIKRDEEVAFDLLMGLLPTPWQQTAFPAAHPKWREDDAGTRRGELLSEIDEMHQVAKNRIMQLSQNNAKRIAELLKQPALRNEEDRPKIFALTEPFQRSPASDEDKEVLYAALRDAIAWHRKFDDSPEEELAPLLRQCESAYEAVAPVDLVVRNRWLFAAYWVELPIKQSHSIESSMLNDWQAKALTEIFHTQGMAGIERLIEICAAPETIAYAMADLPLLTMDWPAWIMEKGSDFAPERKMTQYIRGLLDKFGAQRAIEVVRAILRIGAQWEVEKQVRVLLMLPTIAATWHLVIEMGAQIETEYWQRMQPAYSNNGEELNFALQKLLQAGRARTAVWASIHTTNPPDTKLLFLALQSFVSGQEANGPLPDSWHLGELLKKLQNSAEIEKQALMRLEFALLRALGFGNEEQAVTLYEGVTSEPQIFTELLCLLYKPKKSVGEEAKSAAEIEIAQANATQAFHVLRACKRVPGIQADGSINAQVLNAFIDATRELCNRADRQAVADLTLGEILAYASADEDGTWPCTAIRDILDRPDLEDLRRGFDTGTINKRGVTVRSPWDGGEQERELADYFLDQARRVQHSHIHVAAMLEEIAEHYERYAEREDEQANLNKESY